jgi:hypothetical protein
MQLKTIKLIFLIAGIYDIILGLMTLFLTDYLAVLLDTPTPSPLLFPQATGLFLIALGYLLIYALKDIKKYAFIGFASLFVRYSFVLIIILTVMTQTVEIIYLFIALTDFITGTLLLVTFFSKEIDMKDFIKLNFQDPK